MLTRKMQEYVVIVLAALVSMAFVGCESGPKYGPYNLSVTVGEEMTSGAQRLDVDVVGTTEELNIKMEEYWAERAENERSSGMAQTLWFESGTQTQEILKNAEIWETWKSKGVKYLFVIPHSSKWRGQNGKVINLSSDVYEDEPTGFEIMVFPTYANVNTIF